MQSRLFANFKVSLISMIIKISLIIQSFGSGVHSVSADSNQNLIMENEGISENVLNHANYEPLVRPSIKEELPILGTRHTTLDMSSTTGNTNLEINKAKRNPSLLFVENVGQYNSKESFELRLDSSIMRFTNDSIWFTLFEPERTINVTNEFQNPDDSLSLSQQKEKEETQKGVNIQVKFIGANNKSTIEGINRSESKMSFFYGNKEDNWHPDVPVWNGIRYVDLYPGVDLEISGIDGSWLWTLVIKDSVKLLNWVEEKKGNDIRFQVIGTKSNKHNEKSLQLSSEIGELFLPDIQILWEDGNLLGIEEQEPFFEDNDLVLMSNDQLIPFLPTLTPSAEPTQTETIFPTETPTEETPTLEPTSTETLIPTDTPTEEIPTSEPTLTETLQPTELPTELPTDEILPTEPIVNEVSSPTEITIEENLTSEADLLSGENSTETQIPTESKNATSTETSTPTSTEAPEEEPTIDEIQATETPTPTLTETPIEETLTTIETSVIFDETYVWNFSNTTEAEQYSSLSQSVQGMIYATYLGGPSGIRDTFIDPEGFVYAVGDGNSPGFPSTPGAFKVVSTGNSEGFVTKLYPDGSNLVYSTFLGGSVDEQVLGIAVDDSGLAYVGGWTSSSDFPTTPGVYQPSNRPTSSLYDAFITKLNADGTGLVYSTYLGGFGSGDQIWDLTIDSTGQTYVVGMSSGIGFPTTPGAYDTVSTEGYEGFVAKLSSNASTLIFSTFLGGSGAECAQYGEKKNCSIFIDTSRNVYIVGNTWSSDFPTTSNAYDQTYNGNIDAFFTKFDPTGSNLLYSTFLGGTNTESYGTLLGAIDTFGAAYFVGTTNSSDFPITLGTYHGGRDIFITKLYPDSRGIVYSSMVGGTGDDIVRALDIAPNGDIYITGETFSSNFPVTQNAFQSTLNGQRDVFLTKIGPDGMTISYSTYLGGSSVDVGYALSRSQNTTVAVAGYTYSFDFPTTAGAFQPTGPGNESFVAVFSLETTVQDYNVISACGSTKNKGFTSSDGRECPLIQGSQGSAGDPINTRTGGLDVSYTDISFPTVAGDLVFQRYYSSTAVNSFTEPFGPGWTHNHDTRLVFPSDPGGNPDGILFKAHSLNSYLFYDNGDGTYSPESGMTSSLVEQTDPSITYTVTDQSQHVYSFDEFGKLTVWNDGKGHTWSYGYDANNLLNRVTDDTSSNYLEFTYSPEGYLSSVTDNMGRSVSYGYDSSNDLVSVTDVLSQVWNLTYDPSHHLRMVTDPSSKTIMHTEYDAQGRAFQQYDGENNLVTQISYNLDGTRVITDGEGNDITHSYSSRNTLYSTQNSLDNSKQFAFDDNFRLSASTDENSNSIAMNWSANGANLLTTTDAEGNRTDLFYDSLNNLQSVTLPSGVSNEYTYSGTLLTGSTDSLEHAFSYTYTDTQDAPAPAGLLETITDPLNHVTRYEYNNLGQMTLMFNAVNQETQYLYDSWGNVKAIVYPSGRQDWTCYNAAGQLVRTIQNASGGYDYWTYEPCSDYYMQIDDNSADFTTWYFYDSSGNNISIREDDLEYTRYYYDQNNRLIATVENLTDHDYLDPTPPIFNNTRPDQNIRTDYSYDGNGNLIATTNTLGIITRTYFDSENRPEYVVNNLSGQDISVSTPPSYNPLYPDENIVTQSVYDPVGNQIASIDPNGIITRTYYDKNNRPITIIQNLVGQAISETVPPVYNSSNPDKNIRMDTVYDSNGNVIASIDTLGRITRTYYTALDQPMAIVQNLVGQSIETSTPPVYNPTYPDQNLRTDYFYDAAGNQIAVVDPNGVITRTYYDALNRQTVVVQNLLGQSVESATPPTYNPLYPDQNVRIETVYDGFGQVIASIDPNGIVSRVYLDGIGRTSSIVQNLTGQSIEAPYLPLYNPAYSDQNVRTDIMYDTWGNSFAQKFNDGMITRSYYDRAHRIVGSVDNLTNWWVGNSFMPTYDPNYPDQNVITITSYNGLGNVVSTTDPNGGVTYSCYDSMGRVIKTIQNPSITNPCEEYVPSIETDHDIIQINRYDAAGNVLENRDPLGKITSYAYDDLGRLLSVTDPLSHPTSFEYDGIGNQVLKTDAESVVTKYEYDSANRLVAVVENFISGTPSDTETNVRTEYSYDANGNLLSIKNARNQYTYFTYDNLNRLITEIDPLNNTTTYVYDAAGNQVSKMDANGYTTFYSYDALSRLDIVDNPGSDPDVEYTYNDAGRFEMITDGLGNTQWTYDGLGRITSLVDPNNQTIGYEYYAGGNRKSTTYPDLKQVTYAYDSAGRLSTVSSWDTSATSYQYDRKGQLDLVTLPDLLSTDYTFNDAGYLTQKVNSVNSTTLSSFGYTYDNVGNRISAYEYGVLAVATPGSDALFSDSFESIDLSKWNRSKTDQGDLSVTSQAAMTGTYGLSALIDDNNSLYTVDWSPRNETRYKASFKFDLNSIAMTLDDAHYLFYAYNASGTGMLRVEFQKARKGYQVRAESLKDSGWNSTSWFTVSDTPHTIQVEWKAATSSSTHNGTLQLWIDGASQQLITKVDNDTVRLDSVRLGAVEGVDAGTRGTEFFDDFNSWRSQAWVPGESFTRTITYDYDPLYRLTSASSSDGDLFQYT